MRIRWSKIVVGLLEQSGSRRSGGGWRACRRRDASSIFDILLESLIEENQCKNLRFFSYKSMSCGFINYLGQKGGHDSRVQQSDQRRRLKITSKFCSPFDLDFQCNSFRKYH
jgi:hypothetical protein